MVDAVLLEWEGVLADTAGARAAAWQRALADQGVVPGSHVADPVVADLLQARAARAFTERLGQGFVLMPGVRQAVNSLRAGSRITIVTAATRADTEFALRLAGLDAAVGSIVSVDDAATHPPHPAIYERAIDGLARLSPVRRAHVVAMAPSASYLRAARAAGVRTVAVGAPAHVAVEADGAIDSLDGLTPATLARIAGVPSGVGQR